MHNLENPWPLLRWKVLIIKVEFINLNCLVQLFILTTIKPRVGEILLIEPFNWIDVQYFISLAALSDAHGNFILNGNFVVSMSKRVINIQGAIFEYSGSNNTIERINSSDKVEEELTLQVHVYFSQKFENFLHDHYVHNFMFKFTEKQLLFYLNQGFVCREFIRPWCALFIQCPDRRWKWSVYMGSLWTLARLQQDVPRYCEVFFSPEPKTWWDLGRDSS